MLKATFSKSQTKIQKKRNSFFWFNSIFSYVFMITSYTIYPAFCRVVLDLLDFYFYSNIHTKLVRKKIEHVFFVKAKCL